MSWVSLSGSDGGDSGKNSYKEVAKQAFASPTNLSSRLGNRTPAAREGLGVGASGSFGGRRAPSRINSQDEAEAFHQMFNSTAVQVSKKPVKPLLTDTESSGLGEGLKALAKRASRQYHAELSNSMETKTSTHASDSFGDKDSFSIGSVSRRTKDLDLANNDNSFHVIGGLIVEFFQSKQKAGQSDLRLTAQDLAQLDRLAPPRVRASFVEAVRYRFTNAPMDSTTSVHMLARQCHDLGLDAEGPQNPLLVAAEAEIVIPVPRAKNNTTQSQSNRVKYRAMVSQPLGADMEGESTVAPSGSAQSNQSSASESRSTEGKSHVDNTTHDTPSNASGHTTSVAAASDPPNNPISTRSPPATLPASLLPNFGRPPRQSGEDPPAGSASVSTRLTKLGVEVPYGSEVGSVGNTSSAPSGVVSQSEASSVHKPDPSVCSVHQSVKTSLTKFGIEMPKYDDSVSSLNNGEGASVQTDVKSMTTSLTKLGVEIPLSGGEGPAQSEGSVKSPMTSQSSVVHAQLPTHHQTVPVFNAAILSLSSKTDEESSILQAGSSKDYSNGTGIARQQLMAELREASNLMKESKTQEAARFWRDHVLELEARIRALDGEEGTALSNTDEKESITVDKSLSAQGEVDAESEQLTDEQTGAGDKTLSTDRPSLSNSLQAPSTQLSVSQENMGPMRAPLMLDPSLEGVPMVDVVAPADLPGGYHFEAEIEGRRFLATVPAGGVQKGETFSCYMRDLEKVGSDVPVGRWRDGLFDCCNTGCCHPVICNAVFCPLVLLGQIMTRVGFDFLGRPSLDNSINGPGTLWSILGFWLFVNVALFSAYNFKWSQGLELSMADLGALAFVNVSYTLFIVYLTSATRGSLREKYYIRESRFHDLEDCCCATFCLPCSVCQMARHTADYDEYEGVCCNDTGLPDAYEAGESTDSKQGDSYIV